MHLVDAQPAEERAQPRLDVPPLLVEAIRELVAGAAVARG